MTGAGHGKIKIQWIMDKAARKAAFRKRRATLLEKAHELSVLCRVPVAVVVFGGPDGAPDAPPTVWPAIPEATEILQRFAKMPENSKGAHKLDKEGFMRERNKKMKKKVENHKISNRELEVNLVLNDISLGRRRDLDDLRPDLATKVRSLVDALRSFVTERVNYLSSDEGAAAVAAAAAAAAAVAVPGPVEVEASQQEAPVMAPALAVVPTTVENTALVQPPSSLEAWLLDPEPPATAPTVENTALLEPPSLESWLLDSVVVPLPPLATAPMAVPDAPLLLPAAPLVELEPQAADDVLGADSDDPFDLYSELPPLPMAAMVVPDAPLAPPPPPVESPHAPLLLPAPPAELLHAADAIGGVDIDELFYFYGEALMVPPLATMAPMIIPDAPLLLPTLPAEQPHAPLLLPAPPVEQPHAPLLLPALPAELPHDAGTVGGVGIDELFDLYMATMVVPDAPLLLPEPPHAPLLLPAPSVELPHAAGAVGGVGIDEPFDLYGELEMVLPLAMAPMAVPDAPLLLPAPPPVEPQSGDAVVGVGIDDPFDLYSELLMMSPLAMAPIDVPDTPLLLPAPPVEPHATDVGGGVGMDEPLMGPPLPMAPMVAPDAPLLLSAPPVGEPQAADAVGGEGIEDEPYDLYGEPRDGSYLLEMADAIMDDGTGRNMATAEDVDRLLREHGLEQFIKPK